MIEEIRNHIINNGCYPVAIKEEIKNQITFTDPFYDIVSPIYDKFHKNGNIEKLYGSIFSKVILDAQKYFGLGRDVSTLIVKKLTDRFTALRKELSREPDEDDESNGPWIPFALRPLPEFSEMEQHGLRYIGGYVYKKLYKEMKNSKDWSSPHIQMAIAYLEAGRDDTETHDTFFDQINRGGLWKVSPTAEELFLIVEVIFRRNTSKKGCGS